MKIERVYTKNATYQMFEVLKTNRNKRYKQRAFLVEGVRNINEAVRCGWEIVSFLYAGEAELSGWARQMLAEVPTEVNYQLLPALMAEISGKTDTSELLAIVRMRPDEMERVQLGEVPLLALFDRPSNRGNLGTIIRSCDALGVDALILTGHGVDLYDADVIVSSMGSFFRVPVIRMPDHTALAAYLEGLRARYPGFVVLGTTAHRERPVYGEDLTRPLLMMVGNETDGLSRGLREMCDGLVTVPMAEGCAATSLNVGCAATVLLYEVRRQRG